MTVVTEVAPPALAGDPAQDHSRRAERALAEARRLVPVLAERAALHDRAGTFPRENYPDLHAAGLLNLTVPVERGGEGLDVAIVTKVVETLATGDPGTALTLVMQYRSHAGLARGTRSWPEDVYRHVVAESLAGVALINGARVEPELGTPARGGLPATIARRTPGGWKVTGRKLYTTGAPVLRWAVVWARSDEDPIRVGGFLVPLDAPGVSIEDTWDHLGMRTSGNWDLVLEDAEIPYEYAVNVKPEGEARGSFDVDPVAAAEQAFLSISTVSAVYHGVAKAARDWLVGYLHERKPSNLGASLATVPRIQAVVGEIDSLLYVNDRLLYDHETAASKPPFVKQTVTANAIRAVTLATELVGNPGLSRKHPLERHLRDVLYGRIHTPQTDVVFTNGGKAGLGLGPARFGGE